MQALVGIEEFESLLDTCNWPSKTMKIYVFCSKEPLYLIVATARSEGIVTLCVASTALAAQNYPGGRTAHSQLGIPAAKRQKGKRVECNLELGSQHAKFLSNVQLIIWDEIYSSNRFDIEREKLN